MPICGEKAKKIELCEAVMPLCDNLVKAALILPDHPRGAVLFAHGSGSGRLSPRNQFVAQVLARNGMACLLFDLLTEDEGLRDEVTHEFRFDVRFLSKRLIEATRWAWKEPHLRDCSIGYFGSSTGAGAALIAAAKLGAKIGAVVSRGGRPDLASRYLRNVVSPTLLIVGGYDNIVIGLNQKALARLRCEKELVAIPRCCHLFEEPGALERVADIASVWFQRHLGQQPVCQEYPMQRRVA